MPEPITTTDDTNSCGPGECWRLVYADSEVRSLFESGGSTETKDSLYAGTLAECVAEAKARNLTIPESVADHLDREARVALGLPERKRR